MQKPSANCEAAKALATERSGALNIASRYKETMRRVQVIPPSLTTLTVLHSANLLDWDKRSRLPTHTLHNIPDIRICGKVELGKDEQKRWAEVNKTHIS